MTPTAGTRYAGGPQDSPGYLLWHATLRWQRSVTSALAPLDLTHVQFVLLACLWWLQDQPARRGSGRRPVQSATGPNQLRLARQAGTDVKMTSQVLGALERKGLVERRTDPLDSRAKTVHLTAGGAELVRRAVVVVERADQEFFAPAVRAGRGGGADRVVALLRALAPLD